MTDKQDAIPRAIVSFRKDDLARRSESFAGRCLQDVARIENARRDIFDAVTAGDAHRVGVILQGDPTQANARNRNGWPVLRWAARLGRRCMVHLLLKRGANAKAEGTHLSIVRMVRERRADTIGTPAIVTATIHDDTELVALLLDQGEDIQKSYSQRGETPLHLAASKTRADMVKMLVARGADVDAADVEGLTPLMWATRVANLGSARALIALGAWLDVFSAAALGLRDAVNEMIAADPTLANAPMNGWRRFTPLHFAAARGQVSVAQLLLSKEADVNSRDNLGITPLHLAAVQGHLEVVQLLMATGANPNAASVEGRTPLHDAAAGIEIAVITMLLNAGAEANAEDEYGMTSLHRLGKVGPNDPILRAGFEARLITAARIILQHGAAINAKDASGLTPMRRAAKRNLHGLAEFLRQQGGTL